MFIYFFFNIYLFIYLFIYSSIYSWLCWVFVSVRGPSPVAASGGHPSSRCAGLSPSRPLPSRSTGSRCAGSAIVAHGPSRSAARGIFPDQGSNPCALHWQADSQPLCHQGSPIYFIYSNVYLSHKLLIYPSPHLSPLVTISLFSMSVSLFLFAKQNFFNDTATTEIYTLSLHDALPISDQGSNPCALH